MSTLRDVAKKSEVSITTVSRVINNPEKVSKNTRERVQKAMGILDYKPNRVAQRLRGTKGKSKLLGLIIPDIQNPFYSDIVRGIEDVAYGNHYAVILCNSDEDAIKEEFYLNVLRSESVDGIILPPIRQYGKVVEELVDFGIPLVCVDRKFEKKQVDTVVVNNKKGAYSAVSHLLEKSHERIALITSLHKFSSFQEREEGYRKALKDYEIEFDENLVKEGDPRSSEDAREITLNLLKSSNPPTALFVTNNLMSLGALNAIRKLNYKIPDDISLIMFDDMPWAKVMSPSLTTVKQPGYEIGRRAGELFFQRVEDPKRETVEVMMETKLIVRESTAHAKKGT